MRVHNHSRQGREGSCWGWQGWLRGCERGESERHATTATTNSLTDLTIHRYNVCTGDHHLFASLTFRTALRLFCLSHTPPRLNQ